MAAPPRTPLAEGKGYYVSQPLAEIAAETASRRRTRPSRPVEYRLPTVTARSAR